MKKKILKIASIVMLIVLLAAISAVGTFFLIRNKNVEETGNVFGISWYNEDDLEFTITTQKELYEFARLSDYYSFKKQTVKLGADIVVNEGNASDWAEKGPKLRWTPIRNFAGRFDGQGHTISGIYGKSNGSKMALFVDTDYNCTIKNVKLVNSYFETSGGRGVASFVSNGGGKLSKLYSDAIFSHRGEYCGGIASKVMNQTSFDECWFDGKIELTQSNVGGIVDMISGGRVTMNHCLFSGQIVQDYDFARAKTGGIAGCIMKKATVIITDSLACGTISTTTDEAVGALFGITDSGVNFTITNSYVSRDSHDVLNGIQGGNYTGNALSVHGKDLEGVKAYQRTLLDFTRYWAVTEDSTPVLRCFAETVPSLEGVSKDYDTDWYVKGNYNFEITTREQLYGLMLLSASNDFTDVVFKLGDDIVMNEGKAEKWGKEAPELSWYGIRNFNGTFDGQGHTVNGLYLNEAEQLRGFFTSVLTQGDVQNFQLKNSYFESTTEKYAMMGSVAGDLRGRLQNVYSDAIVVAHGDQFGGIVGRVYDNDNTGNADDVVEVTNCWFDGKVYGARNGVKHIGGVVGYLTAGDLNISHCLNTGTVESETDDRGVHLGGIFGAARGQGTLNISDCLNTGDIVVKRDTCVGSVIGRGWDETVTINISNTYATYESYLRGIGDNSASTVNGGVVILPENMLTGYNAYKYSTLDFPGYWAIVKEDTPILQNFAGSDPSTAGIKRLVDTSWYKADAKTFVIDSVEDLYGFMVVSAGDDFTGKTVKLGADIQVNAVDEATLAAWKDRSAVAENLWAPISGRYKGFAGTFDGQGHTISGLYLSSWVDFSGFFSSIFPTGVVKNFSIKDSYFECTTEKAAAMGSVAGDLRGKMENVYSNATVVSYGNQVGGLVGRAYDKDSNTNEKDAVEVVGSWFDGEVYVARDGARGAGGIVGWLIDGDLNISHCLNSGQIESETKVTGVGVGGIFGTARGKGILNISDCLNTGDIVVKRDTCVGAVIGQGWDKTVTINITDSYASYESYHRGMGDNSASKVIGGVALLPEEMLTGYNAYKYSTLDFPGYWAVVETDTPILQNFAGSDPSTAGVKKIIDTTWYKPDAETYTINTVDELYGFMALSTGNDFKGKTVKLGKDIQVNAVDEAVLEAWKDGSAVAENLWSPISTAYVGFAGTFDGQGYTISGLYLLTDMQFSGFFSSVFPTGVVKNFSIEDSYFECTTEKDAAMGSVVGDHRGKMENVYSNATVVSYGNQVGGLVGRAYDKDRNTNENDAVEVVSSWFDGEVYVARDGARGAGGIVGWLIDGDLNISHCLNSGQIESETKVTGVGVGGIFGTARGKGTLDISDCLNTGDIVVKRDTCVGAVVGQGWDKTVTINIANTYATDESHTRGIGDNTASKVKGDVVRMPEQYYLGTECYKWTLLDYTEHWAARKNDTPSLKYFEDQKLKQDGVLADIDWYDADDKKLYIKNAEDFYGFTALVRSGVDFEGQTVYLDVEDNELKLDKNSPWLPIGTDASPFAGMFDGKDATITGLNIAVENGTDIGLFGVTAKGSVLQNFSIKDSKITYSSEESLEKQVIAGIGTVCGTLGGQLKNVYSDADIDSTAAYVGGLVAFATGGSSIENCWYDGDLQLQGEYATYGGGIVAVAAGGNVEITQCLNTGRISNEKTTAAQFLGGIIGGDSAVSQVLIKDCIAAGKVSAKRYNGVSSIVGMGNKEGSTYTFDNVYTTDTSCSQTISAATSYVMYKASAVDTDKITFMKEKYYLGTAGYQWTSLDFEEEKWAARAGEIPAPETLVSDALDIDQKIIRADISWAETEPYEIKDEADFCGLARLVHNGNTFKNKTIYLRADLKMNDVNLLDGKKTVTAWMNGTETPENTWMPIGYDASKGAIPFEGRFTGLDGDQIHSISGIFVDGDWRSEGLFGRVGSKGQIDNLILENSYIYNSNGRTGSIAGWMEGKLENVYATSSVIVKGEGANASPVAATVGGLVGFAYAKDTTYGPKNCWFAGDVHATGRFAGGFIGWAYAANLTLSDCLFTGNVYSTYASASSTGGVIGHISGATNITLENCVSNGFVQVVHADGAGSVLGMIELSSNKAVANIIMKNVYTNDNCDGDSDAISGCGKGTITNAATFKGVPTILTSTELEDAHAYIHTQLLFRGSSEDTNGTGSWVTTTTGPELVSFSDTTPATLTGQRINTGWYYNNLNKGASAKTYTISDAASMYGLSRLVNDKKLTFAGDTINLNASFNMNKGWTPSIDTTTGKAKDLPTNITALKPIGTQNGTKFTGIFDGNGYTISGLYVQSLSDRGTGLFGCIDSSEAKIQNLRLIDSYVESTNSSYKRIGSVVGWAVNGTLQNVYSAASLYSEAPTVGGLVGLGGGNVTINSSWYGGNIKTRKMAYEVGGLVGTVLSSTTTTIDTCLYTGNIDSIYRNSTKVGTIGVSVGGLCGSASGTLNVSNSICAGTLDFTLENSKSPYNLTKVGSISGNHNAKTKVTNTYDMIQARYKITDKADVWNTVTFTGGVAQVSGSTLDVDASFKGDVSAVYGNTAVTKLKNLKFTRGTGDTESLIWKWREGALPIPEGLSRNIPADTSWYDASVTKQYIDDESDMYGLTKLVADGNTFEGKEIFLTDNLEMNPMDATTLQSWIDGTAVPENFWTPIGVQNGTHFKGVFDGQGHKISGLYVSANTDRGTGLFGCISGSNAAIKNLKLIDSYIESTNSSSKRIGSIVGWAVNGTLQNVYSTATLYSEAPTVGGLVGLCGGNVTINSSWYGGNIKTRKTAYEVGGLVGTALSNTTTTIVTCLYTGNIDSIYKNSVTVGSVGVSVGGLCGSASGTINVSNSICAGTLDFTLENSKSPYNLTKVGSISGSHNANTRVTNTYDMIQARYKITDKADVWNTVTFTGGVAQVSGSTLDVDASFKGKVTEVYGDAADSKLTKLKFNRPGGDTISLIWKERSNALPIPEGLSTFYNK